MLYSDGHIRTTHAGSLPRPDELRAMVQGRMLGEGCDESRYEQLLTKGVADVVKRQADAGIDSVNDGEFSKVNFTNYVRERIEGFERREVPTGKEMTLDMTARDREKFNEYFEENPMRRSRAGMGLAVCTSEIKYVGHTQVQKDIENFKAALKNVDVEEAYLPANTPGTIEHWMPNEYYNSDEEFVFAIAEAMREEYEAIVEAGLLLQIDDPDLPDGWNCLPRMDIAQYQAYAQIRVEALNYALRNVPPEKVRLHVCWGSFHGPHAFDIPLRDIVDLVFSVRAMSFSIEASNPCHEHEWRIFEDIKLPVGATLVPGVVGHCTDFVEHPDLVAERVIRYANLLGKENVLAGTDCGLGHRVGHPTVCWAKLEALSEGAKRASKQLWS